MEPTKRSHKKLADRQKIIKSNFTTWQMECMTPRERANVRSWLGSPPIRIPSFCDTPKKRSGMQGKTYDGPDAQPIPKAWNQ